MTDLPIDLLSTVEYGGCSAKLSPKDLEQVLDQLPLTKDPRLLVDIETHDDAGVYQINDHTALIFTTDFFPPICSDPFEFGQIAATNALSDVYAMGGTPILALNLMMFSAAKLPMQAYAEILKGGDSKVREAGAFTVGGHTIDDHPPKYGLAVVGTISPEKLITNAGAKPGQKLVLSKPLGTGALVAGQRMEMSQEEDYRRALAQMKLLNRTGAELAQKHGVTAMTDVTGFSLLGHGLKMARASGVTLKIDSVELPILPGAYELYEEGCIPGASFRNLDFVSAELKVEPVVDNSLKMLACDAQTSGGLLMAVPALSADQLVADLVASGDHPQASVVGEVLEKGGAGIALV